MEAGAGYRPSYAWQSKCFSREFLSNGLMKSIGNGLDTNVWFNKWVFDETPRRPINIMDLNLKVADLIYPGGKWNVSKLHTLFSSVKVTRISSLPPSLKRKDNYLWAYTRYGNYYVKSGNWLVTQPMYGGVETSPQIQADNALKAKVWSLKTLLIFICFFGMFSQGL